MKLPIVETDNVEHTIFSSIWGLKGLAGRLGEQTYLPLSLVSELRPVAIGNAYKEELNDITYRRSAD